jgi:hypothetical protein
VVQQRLRRKNHDRIQKAEAVVTSLEAKRAACIQKGTELADERANVALSAHTGDAKALDPRR